MFGLSIKEKIYKIIIHFYDTNMDEYLEQVESIIREGSGEIQSKLDKKLNAAKIEYNQLVFKDSREYIAEKLPKTESRILEALKNPEKLGLDKKDLVSDITPGKILIVLLYSTKRKPPKAKECSALDFVVHEKLRKKLVDLDAKIDRQ